MRRFLWAHPSQDGWNGRAGMYVMEWSQPSQDLGCVSGGSQCAKYNWPTSYITIPSAQQSDSRVGRPLEPKQSGSNNSGLIRQNVPPDESSVSDRNVVVRSVMVIRPKSAMRAMPKLSTRMFACFACLRSGKISGGNWTHPFKVYMNNPEVMKITQAGHDFRKLRIPDKQAKIARK